MKLLTNFTIFSEELITKTFIEIMSKELNIELIKMIKGVHRDAPRVHQHVMCIWEDPKPIKFLNQKVSKIKNKYEEFKDIDIRTAFTYEDNKFRSNQKNKYDEDVLKYALKEYTDNLQMIDSVEYVGYTESEIHDLRKEANKIWEQVKEKKTKEKESKNNIGEMYQYVDLQIIKDGWTYSYPSFQEKKRKILKYILVFKKKSKDKIFTNQLKDLIINYLFSRDVITEYEIMECIYL